MNVCVFKGRATKDVEIKTVGEKTVGLFSIAVKNGPKTSFFNCAAYGKVAKSMEGKIKKGSRITVEAKARQKKFKDQEEKTRSYIDFVVSSWEVDNYKENMEG